MTYEEAKRVIDVLIDAQIIKDNEHLKAIVFDLLMSIEEGEEA